MSKDKKTQPFPISNLKYLNDNNKINFSPAYQREYVWKDPQRSLFIDSLFLGYDIPKIYFHENPHDNYKYDVVDGQQRLQTIFHFLKGVVKLPGEADPIDGETLANKKFEELSLDLQMMFQNISLDIVILNSEYTQDDIEDMFLRYQNGEPLNAPEKRKAIPGNFKNIVEEISKHKVFSDKCIFKDHRGAYQDAAAKILHNKIHGTNDSFQSISASALKRTYFNNKAMSSNDKHVKDVIKALNFIETSFNKSSNKNPGLKKFSILTLTAVILYLMENYAINEYKKEIANAYLDFELERQENNELEDESLQDTILNNYTDAARGDSPVQQKYRFDTLLTYILSKVQNLKLKDSQRAFTTEQRVALYRRDNGICQSCKVKVEFNDFHADHIIPHSKGGETKLSNGQVLCSECNQKKSNKDHQAVLF